MSLHRVKPPQSLQVGPTGEFPEGRLNADDEGELRIGIAADLGAKVVRIDFGKPIAWLAFPPNAARALANVLIEKANQIEPLT